MRTRDKPIGRTRSALAVVLTTLGCAPPGPRLPTGHTVAMRKTVHVGPPLGAAIGYLADELVPVATVAFMQARLSATRCREAVLLQGSKHVLPWNAEANVRSAIAWAAGTPPC